ncbi:T9SS type A sorting domain-containing protein [Flavobacteriaceae bacterium]|nr:T9SS type A sorting domain-containing protein [Flavobacteriaceae bacterium]
MKKITFIILLAIFSFTSAFAQFIFPIDTGSYQSTGATPQLVAVNDAANSAAVPAGVYVNFTVTYDWSRPSGYAWSSEEALNFTTTNGTTLVGDPPTTGGADSGASTTLTFSGAIPGGSYDPSVDGFLELGLFRSYNAIADITNISVTILPETEAPECASNPTPATGSTDLSVGSVTLTWDAPASGPTPTAYNLYAGIEADGSDLALVGEYSSNAAAVTVNGYDTTIYWQVLPLNGFTETTGCDLWNFTTASPPTGSTCTDPIVVSSLPYNETGGTTNGFGDDYSFSPGTSCGTTGNYLNGDDIVYSYTASFDGSINFSLTNITDNYTGLFVYADCADIGTTCLAGDYNGGSTADLSVEDFSVTTGTTYYMVISTWSTPQTTTYDLTITENTCTNATVDFSVLNDCDVSGGFNIEVNITDMGTAMTLNVTDNQGSTSQVASMTGVLTFGPYTNGNDVVITVTDADDASCVVTSDILTQVACPPSNDSCDTATLLDALPFTSNGDATAATNNSGFIDDVCEDSWGYNGMNDGVWYTFTPTVSGTIDLELDSTGWDAEIAVYTGSCGVFACVDRADAVSISEQESLSIAVVAGTQYFVNLGYYSGFSDGSEGVYEFRATSTDASLGIEEVSRSQFTYFPNPVNDVLTIKAQKTVEDITVFNMLGQVVKQQTPNTMDCTVDLSAMQSGAYFVQVSIDNSVETVRILKN